MLLIEAKWKDLMCFYEIVFALHEIKLQRSWCDNSVLPSATIFDLMKEPPWAENILDMSIDKLLRIAQNESRYRQRDGCWDWDWREQPSKLSMTIRSDLSFHLSDWNLSIVLSPINQQVSVEKSFQRDTTEPTAAENVWWNCNNFLREKLTRWSFRFIRRFQRRKRWPWSKKIMF